MSHWLDEKLQKIKEFGQAITSGLTSDANSEARYAICKECEFYGIKTSGNILMIERGCNECMCFLPVKVLFKDSTCPKNYWPTEILEDVERINDGLFGEGEYPEDK